MAKANETSSIIVRIWLREALELAVAALGSVALAKERLIEWLAAGKLPWSCISWEGLDAEAIKNLDPELRTGPIMYEFPSVAYHEGDPKFWGVFLHIDWEDNAAVEPVLGGARARGIKVSRTHLLALLPEESREREEANGPVPADVQTAEKRPGPQMHRVLQALEKLYPPDGKVPDDVRTETVRAQVTVELEFDSKMRGLAAPSWDTVNRAVGRG